MRRLILLTLLGAAPAAFGDVRLPRLLSDGVILQRDTAASIWGWADDGETVRILLDGKPVGNVRSNDGEWRVQIPEQPAGGPHVLRVEGGNAVTVRDVWFGDVWLAGGQSNMELPMARVAKRFPDAIAGADYPLMRQFDVPRGYDFHAPHADLDGGEWVASSPETVPAFSAVAWFFARDLHQRYDVPIGILSSNYGGTTAEGWMSEAALKDFPRHLETALRYRDDAYLQGLIEADRRTAETWHAEVDRKDPGIDPQDPWYRPAHDTGDWPPVRVPGSWAGTAVGPIYGAVWYRREIVLPEPLDGKPAELELGRIVHSDVTWVNGVKVGETTYEWPPRRYEIPPGLLHAGTNVIAVRVVSGIDGAGFVEDKPYELRVGSRRFDLTGQWRYHLGAAAERLPPPRFVEWHSPLGFYNAMLAPVVNMTIKGVIWYQGESNVGRAEEYRRLFPAMICEWRGHWGQGDLPFLFVQLANYLEPTSEPVGSAWAELREAQRSALKVPNTAMAVAIDVGVANDIHPTDKKSVGDRLALAARHVAYGEQELVWSGPMFRSIESRSGRLILEFDHTGSGLVARGGPLETFAVAGRDGDWRWAQAKIDGDRVIVWSEDVPDPVAVRYAWADNPVGANLYNREGLPASPFEAKLPPGS